MGPKAQLLQVPQHAPSLIRATHRDESAAPLGENGYHHDRLSLYAAVERLDRPASQPFQTIYGHHEREENTAQAVATQVDERKRATAYRGYEYVAP